MTTMKAILVRAPMDFGLQDVPKPECPPAGLLLEVAACGLCGSDLRTLRSGHRKVTLPWILGHEISGQIAELGTRYQGPWQQGDRLSVAPLVYCGQCDFCQSGQYELCEGYREIAQAWPGGFAEYLAVPEEAIHRGTIRLVPEGLDMSLAAIAEPVSSCIHAQEKGAVGLGDTVVVIGTGPVGCIHIALARARGADTVLAVDINEHRLAQAGRFHPDALIDASENDVLNEIRKLTNGRGAEVVITANPSPQAQVQAVEIARKGGRILLFGGLPKTDSRPPIDMNLVHYNALHLIGTTIFAPRHHRQALQLLADGRIDGNALITHRGRLEDFTAIAHEALEGKVSKAVILP
jgi:L-iditol 2-dehydrogenase